MIIEAFNLNFYKNNKIIMNENLKNLRPDENILNFHHQGIETTLDLDQELLIRENSEFQFVLDIKNQVCQIFLKNEGLEVPIEVEECFLKKNNAGLILEYTIESEDAKNKIIINYL